MAESTGQLLEGVFAITKPPSLSSAQVIRDLQTHFEKSRLFAPLVQQTLAARDAEARSFKRRRTNSGSHNLIKMGHGGTLDPMATGVLIIGVGAGTKRLAGFLLCKKTYETTVLFGKSSDTYDIVGKNVAEAPYEHITQEMVEKHLDQFRGKIKQVPPIYSALKINGMKAYEYARSGQELPRELESREMQVSECELLDFYKGGKHDFRWPADDALEEEKKVARKFLAEVEASTTPRLDTPNNNQASKADPTDSANSPQQLSPTITSSSPSVRKQHYDNSLPPTAKAALHTHDMPVLSSTPSPAPAARFRLTVSSGFYVRSFAHDLGRAVGSMGMMASLVRSRQAEFSCDVDEPDVTRALTYAELEQGEEVWGPRVESMLEEWKRKSASTVERQPTERADQRDRIDASRRTPNDRYDRDRTKDGRREDRRSDRRDSGFGGHRTHRDKKRRNSSSPE